MLVHARPQVDPHVLAQRISAETGLKALTWSDFALATIGYYLKRTGIPVNFGITVALGFIVGAAVVGQTFYIFVTENLRQFGALKAMTMTGMSIWIFPASTFSNRPSIQADRRHSTCKTAPRIAQPTRTG